MRNIKFRGWHPDAKDMVYFGLGEDHINCMGLNDGENYTFRLEFEHPVMQFTGLTDLSDVEIYEGDLLVDPEIPDIAYDKGVYTKGLVVFIDGEFSIQYKHGDGALYYEKIRKAAVLYTVIGNIHQNPELLEASNKT